MLDIRLDTSWNISSNKIVLSFAGYTNEPLVIGGFSLKINIQSISALGVSKITEYTEIYSNAWDLFDVNINTSSVSAVSALGVRLDGLVNGVSLFKIDLSATQPSKTYLIELEPIGQDGVFSNAGIPIFFSPKYYVLRNNEIGNSLLAIYQPNLINQINDIAISEGGTVDYRIPDGTFYAYGNNLTYSAKNINGDGIPEWLTFDPILKRIYGTPSSDYVGAVTIRIVATDAEGATAQDDFQVNVAGINDAPTGSVTVNGTATQGEVLTASNNLTDADGLGTISYQWLADGVNISGATIATLTLTQAQVGKAISVKASYTDLLSSAESVTSTATASVVNTNDAPTGSVTISGTAAQGEVLTASNNLTDADGLGTISYQWLADGDNISGATTATLTLTQAQVGKAISVKASYTDLLSSAESVTSTATASVVNINDAPIAIAALLTIDEDTVKTGVLNASDDDFDALTYIKVSNPNSGE